MLGCINRSLTSRDEEVMIPLLTELLRLYLQYYMDSRLHRLERVQRKATKIVKGQGSLPCEERLKEQVYSLEEKA